MTQEDEDTYVAFRLPFLRRELPVKETTIAEMEVQIGRLETEILALPTVWGKLTRKNREIKGRLLTQKKALAGRLRQEREHYENLRLNVQDSALRERFRAMNAVPRVCSATLVADAPGTKLVILTEPLFGRSTRQNTWHCVGPFRITTPIGLGAALTQIVFENLSGPLDMSQTLGGTSFVIHGPTGIDRNGRVSCYGNARPVIEAAFREADDLGLVEVLVRYPECPGQNDNIRLWPEVAADDVPVWYLQHQ